MFYADDLDVSPDIFEYFLGTLPLLQADPTLWCVSAWNDNGKINLVDKNAHDIIYRTDFFPGLGWMLTKSLWNELSVKWPRRWVSNTWYGWASLDGVHSSLISSFVKMLLLQCKELYITKIISNLVGQKSCWAYDVFLVCEYFWTIVPKITS